MGECSLLLMLVFKFDEHEVGRGERLDKVKIGG